MGLAQHQEFSFTKKRGKKKKKKKETKLQKQFSFCTEGRKKKQNPTFFSPKNVHEDKNQD